MRRRLSAWLLLAAAAGCASWPLLGGSVLLARADRLMREGAWEEAAAAYDEYLARFPDAASAPRALESRDTLAAMATARGDLAQLRAAVTQLRRELTLREGDPAPTRQELAARQAEAERLRAEVAQLREELTQRESDLARTRQELAVRQVEAERLRADLERLKQIDLKLERRR